MSDIGERLGRFYVCPMDYSPRLTAIMFDSNMGGDGGPTFAGWYDDQADFFEFHPNFLHPQVRISTRRIDGPIEKVIEVLNERYGLLSNYLGKVTKDITVEVTQEDINNGTGGMSATCPIALAMNRTEVGERWRVGLAIAHCEIGAHKLRGVLPQSAVHFVRDFDHYFESMEEGIYQAEEPEPFTFTMKLHIFEEKPHATDS